MSAPNRKVAWIKPQEPSFLKAFKAKVGYKEPDTIEAKRAKVAPPAGEGDEVEREDEMPTVVVLEKGGVGEEEYEKFREAMKELKKEEEKEEEREDSVSTAGPQPSADHPSATTDEGDDGGRIIFKRPAKRRRSSEGVLDASTKKTGGTEVAASSKTGGKTRSPGTRKRSGSSSGVKNSSLLSFGDEEDD